MTDAATIAGGFAEVEAGAYLAGRGQPAACLGDAVRRRRKGFFLRDRGSLDLVATSGRAWFADSSRPFLTHIPCAAPVSAVSAKVLVAPESARSGADLVRVVPMSMKGALCVTSFEKEWIVTATASRTTRISVEDGGTLSVRPGAVVAWTGRRPTGYVRRLGIWDILLPRSPRELVLHFHGPCVVWAEGAAPRLSAFQLSSFNSANRRAYGV